MIELAKWFNSCNSWHAMTFVPLFAFREFYDLML